MESVALTTLPESNIPILATGGLDSQVHIFVLQEDTFKQVCALQGHQDWIKVLEFTSCDDKSVLLASGSQDAKIRLWKIAPVTDSSLPSSTFM